MKKILSFFFTKIIPKPIFICVLISIITGLVSWAFNVLSPLSWSFWTLVATTCSLIAFVWIRQIWWFITKTGDYKEDKKK